MGNQQLGYKMESHLGCGFGGGIGTKCNHKSYQNKRRRKKSVTRHGTGGVDGLGEGHLLNTLEKEIFMQNIIINAQNRHKIRLGCYDPKVNGSYQNYLEHCESVYLLECIPEFIRNDVRLYQN
jgi:hypothetical protein